MMSRRCNSRRARRAFTLLEVLVALAVFVLMGVVIASSYLNVLNAYEVAARSVTRDDDVRFARSVMMAEADLEVVERGAEFDGAGGRRIRWSATIEPTTVADLFQVTFTCEITGPDIQGTETVEEKFRLLRPTWSQPVDRDKLRGEARNRIVEIQQKQGGVR